MWATCRIEMVRSGSGSRLRAEIEGVAQSVPQQVEAPDHEHDGDAGDGGHVGGRAEIVAPVAQHGAPFGRRWLDAQSQEAEGGGREDRRRMGEVGSKTTSAHWSPVMADVVDQVEESDRVVRSLGMRIRSRMPWQDCYDVICVASSVSFRHSDPLRDASAPGSQAPISVGRS